MFLSFFLSLLFVPLSVVKVWINVKACKITRCREPFLHRQQQHLQGWNQFWMRGIFLSVPRYDLWRLMRSLVTSIFLYACESWTLTAELQRRIQAMEMRCYRKILRILYKDHVTNEEVRAKIQPAIRPHKDLLTTAKRGKLQWYGHVSRSSGLAKTILQGTVIGGRRQGRQGRRWEDNIMKMKCYRKILRISYKDHVTNEEVRAKIHTKTSWRS